MTRRYRVLLPLLVHTADGAYGQDKEFDKEFTEEDERTNVESGLLAIVPSTYRVVGPHVVHGCQPGGTFDAALPIGQEAALVGGGHIERVDPQPTPKRAAKAQPKE